MGADCLSSTDITDAAGSSNSLRSKSSLSSSSVPSGDILAMQSRKQGQCSSQRDIISRLECQELSWKLCRGKGFLKGLWEEHFISSSEKKVCFLASNIVSKSHNYIK